MKVKNLGKSQVELTMKDTRILISYDTPVACEMNGQVFRTSKKWSTTTDIHIQKWLDGKEAIVVEQEFFDKLLEE